jgi:16S rRNA (guanine527-N7)-methyltransferase
LSESPHQAPLEALGLEPQAVAALSTYLDRLEAWGARVNLTGARTAASRVERLVAPVVPALRHLAPGGLLDVGSGNGSPGLVLAVLRPEAPATLLEPRTKRWAFLREAARALGRPDVEVQRLRHDQYDGPPVPNVTLRALALPLDELEGLVAPGGRILLFGARMDPAPEWAPEVEGVAAEGRVRVFQRRRFT